MKNLSFSVFNVFSVGLIILLVVIIVLPFNLINLEQAQRIAKWKSDYEELNYCFSLVKLHEGSIVPTMEEAGKLISYEFFLERIKPYLNIDNNSSISFKNYKYRRMNSSPIPKDCQFNFKDFFIDKKGRILSIRKNDVEIISETQPLFFMFVDINGIEKPNKVGQDIFLLNIYKNQISAVGSGRPHSKLKANCSPIGSGYYCSEYYLLGGRF